MPGVVAVAQGVRGPAAMCFIGVYQHPVPQPEPCEGALAGAALGPDFVFIPAPWNLWLYQTKELMALLAHPSPARTPLGSGVPEH